MGFLACGSKVLEMRCKVQGAGWKAEGAPSPPCQCCLT